jgi:RimJ/RimL family protein N-acetyltransferase
MAVPQRLKTNRLVLRRHRRSDAPAVAALLDDWDVVKWLAQVPFPYREKDALDWVAQTNRHWADGSDYQFVLELKATGTLVGHMGLRIENGGLVGELGYWLGQPYWGRGYGTEGARAMVAFGFDHLGLQGIWAACLPDNRRSIHVLEKAGLVIQGTRRQAFQTRGETYDVPLLALDRLDYYGARAAS